GWARTLAPMLDDRFHRGKFDDITDRADAPIEDAVALMVRGRLTGLAPPPAARKLVELWRPWIEDRAGRDLARLGQLLEDQRRYCDAVPDLPDSREVRGEHHPDSQEDSRHQGMRPGEAGADGQAKQSDEADGMAREEAELADEGLPGGAAEAAGAPGADRGDDADMGDAERAGEPWRPRRSGPNEPRG